MATIRRWVLSVSTTGTAAAFITVSLMNARMIPSMASCSSVKTWSPCSRNCFSLSKKGISIGSCRAAMACCSRRIRLSFPAMARSRCGGI